MSFLDALRLVSAVLCLAAAGASAQELSPTRFPEPTANRGIPSAASPDRLERYLAHSGHRIGMESLGASLGMVLGVAGPMAVAAFACEAEGDFGCDFPMVAGIPGGAFLPSLGVLVMGSFNQGKGGYWYSVAGAASGWITALVLWTIINPLTLASSAAAAIALGALPVGGAVAGYELSSLRAVSREASESELRVSLSPWVAQQGSRGLLLHGAF